MKIGSCAWSWPYVRAPARALLGPFSLGCLDAKLNLKAGLSRRVVLQSSPARRARQYQYRYHARVWGTSPQISRITHIRTSHALDILVSNVTSVFDWVARPNKNSSKMENNCCAAAINIIRAPAWKVSTRANTQIPDQSVQLYHSYNYKIKVKLSSGLSWLRQSKNAELILF